MMGDPSYDDQDKSRQSGNLASIMAREEAAATGD
jgi:hypothetical protein